MLTLLTFQASLVSCNKFWPKRVENCNVGPLYIDHWLYRQTFYDALWDICLCRLFITVVAKIVKQRDIHVGIKICYTCCKNVWFWNLLNIKKTYRKDLVHELKVVKMFWCYTMITQALWKLQKKNVQEANNNTRRYMVLNFATIFSQYF